MIEWLGLLVAAAISGIWCRVLPLIGPRLGFIEQPGTHALKTHRVAAVPLVGPGLLVGIVVGSLLAEVPPWHSVVGLTVVTALGVADDRLDLSPVARLTVELVAAILIALRWSDDGLGYVVAGVVVIVVAVNAVNLYDGLDGLAGGTGLVGAFALALVASRFDLSPWLPALLAGALIGFLPFNRHPASVFLGDGGAYLIGAITAISLMDIGIESGGAGVVAALGFLGMFVVDLVVTVLRRRRLHHKLFEGDRSHLYDRMEAAGMPVPAVATRLTLLHAVIVTVVAMAILMASPWIAVAIVATVGLAAVVVAWQRSVPPP